MTDLRHALRALRASPMVTGLALTILALGIGAGTAIFSVVDAVVLRGLPFEDPDRLVSVGERQEATGEPTGEQNAPIYLDWRAGQQVFEGVGAITGGAGYVLRGRGEPKDVRTRRITHELFPVLRVRPILGSGFTADHEVEGRHRVALLSYGFWQQQFGGDPGIVGQVLTLDHGPFEVLGVMPPGFTYPVGAAEPSEMWVPYVVPPSERTRADSRSYYLQLVARLKPETATRPEVHVPIGQARVYNGQLVIRTRTEPGTLLPEIRRAVSSVLPDGVFPVTRTMDEHLDRLVARRRFNMTLFSLFGVLGLVIALVGIYGVMAYTVQQRTVEFGVRLALGAPRGRILSMVLGRAATFMAAGLVIGLGAALALSRLVAAFLFEVQPGDVVVYASAAGVLVLTGLVAAFLPARRASRVDPMVALRDS